MVGQKQKTKKNQIGQSGHPPKSQSANGTKKEKRQSGQKHSQIINSKWVDHTHIMNINTETPVRSKTH